MFYGFAMFPQMNTKRKVSDSRVSGPGGRQKKLDFSIHPRHTLGGEKKDIINITVAGKQFPSLYISCTPHGDLYTQHQKRLGVDKVQLE